MLYYDMPAEVGNHITISGYTVIKATNIRVNIKKGATPLKILVNGTSGAILAIT